MTTTVLRPARTPAIQTFGLSTTLLVMALVLANPAARPAMSSLFDSNEPSPPTTAAEVRQSVGSLPLQFLPNAGQADPEVSFYLQGAGSSVWFTTEGVTMALPGDAGAPPWVSKLDFAGAREVTPVGTGATGSTVGYFTGPQESWRTGIPTYSGITYPELWPGIDLEYSGDAGKLKYQFVVHPGADPSQIQLAWRGVSSLAVTPGGQLSAATPNGGFTDDKPYTYQQVGGRKIEVVSGYALGAPSGDAHPYGFTLGSYDPALPLVIDPAILVYAGYIGGGGTDQALGIDVDAAGAAYLAGETFSTPATFPLVTGPDATLGGTSDAFVVKVSPNGSTLEYSGYIGGNGFDIAWGITVDEAGAAYVTGSTGSTHASFPVLGGPDLTHNGGVDGFVAKVRPDGTGLEYAGFVGGAGDERNWGIDVDSAGAAYVAGQTTSGQATFPAAGAHDVTFNGGYLDGYLAKVVPDGSGLAYASYIGGNGMDAAWDVAVDAAGAAHVTGETASGAGTFPATVGPDLTYNGYFDSFVAKFTPDGTALDYAGYIGGAGNDLAYGIEVDSSGFAYTTGRTGSGQATFPEVGGPDLTINGGEDAFVTKVTPDGTGLVFAGYIGGAAFDQGLGLDLDSSGAVYIGGQTASDQFTFPVRNGLDATFNYGEYDGFVAKLVPSGASLEYAGYIGGRGYDRVSGIAVGPGNDAFVSGLTKSTQLGFPVTGGPDLTHNGDFDAFAGRVTVQ